MHYLLKIFRFVIVNFAKLSCFLIAFALLSVTSRVSGKMVIFVTSLQSLLGPLRCVSDKR